MENLFLAPAISGFFSVMFDRMIARDLQNFLRPQKKTLLLLEKLRRKMICIDKLLSDAEERQTADRHVKSWLDEVKDALYAAEDLVDKIDTQALHQKSQAECVGSQIVATIGSIFLNNVDNEIEEIYQRFVNLEGEISSLGLKEIAARGRGPSTSSVDESIIFGRHSEKEEIIKFILQMPNYGESSTDASRRKKIGVTSRTSSSPKNKNRIIAITGLSGVGKTTLAQLIYKDSRIDEICNSKSWVCVSEAHGDIRQIIKTIIYSIPSCSSEPESDGLFHGSEDLNSLQGRLLGRVSRQGSKFLFVLDDVMETKSSLLDDLIFPLKSVATDGTILITTSNSLVARKFCPDYTLHLEKLSNEDCWGLLEKLAFQSYPDGKADTGMVDITRELAVKCDGLPLAARVIGLLLNSTKDRIEWERVLDSDAWLQKEILPALLLSYNNLPPYLKRCFAYCSMFPKSCIFERETIVQLWLAEGFVCAENCSLPQVSDNYFDELVSRSFFQQSNSNKSQFVMHSLIHELAHYVSGEFSCFLADDNSRPESTRKQKYTHRTRYLSYLQGEYDTEGRFSGVLSEINYLRTFLPRSSFDSSNCFLSQNVLPYLTKSFMGSMRVLSLSRYKITGRHLLNIDKLEHLRYLDLSYTSICSLPESVCTFYHLKTLLLSDCRNLTWLPDSIGNLKQLLYLSLSRTKIIELPRSLFTLCNLHSLLLSQCPISVLPAELRNLTSLCHLDISGTELQHIPVQIGMLSRLRTLTNLIIQRNGGANVEVLRELKHLKGSISISNIDIDVLPSGSRPEHILGNQVFDSLVLGGSSRIDKIYEVKSASGIRSEHILQNLAFDSLVLEWNSRIDETYGIKSHIFNVLFPSPYLFIKSIIMKYYGDDLTSPVVNESFHNLVSLRLEKCAVPLEWKLSSPCLKHLCLINLKIEDRTNDGPFVFGSCSNLETLRIERLYRRTMYLILVSLDVCISDCPYLEQIMWNSCKRKLELIKCEKLVEIALSRPNILTLQECDALFDTLPCVNAITSLHMCGQLPFANRFMDRCKFLEDFEITDNSNELLSLPRYVDFLGEGSYPRLRRLSISTSHAYFTTFHFGRFINLSYLEIKRWPRLVLISSSAASKLRYLSVVSISDCPELLEFQGGQLPAPSLATFSVSMCRKLRSLPANMYDSLTSLQSLSINDCPEINSFPDGGFPPCLHTLCIKNCPMIMSHRMEWPLHQVSCLRKLEMEGCDSTISFPEKNFLPTSLTHLKITAFRNLSSLVISELRGLESLRALEILLCWKLQSFPERMPPSLCYLEIMGCPELAERCRRDKGRDWSKISHILGINIDGRDI